MTPRCRALLATACFALAPSMVLAADPATANTVNAFLSTLGAQVQGYLSGDAASQLAFLQQNSTAIAQYLASNPTDLQAFLNSLTGEIPPDVGPPEVTKAELSRK